MKRIIKSVIAFLCLCIMGCTSLLQCFAADVANAIIDQNATASLTIFKYDLTTASKDGVESPMNADGESHVEVEELFSPYVIQGVEFSYLKVGEISTRTITNVTLGKLQTSLAYGISQEFADLLDVDMSKLLEETQGTLWFLSNDIADALQKGLNSAETETKNKIESYMKTKGATKMEETDADGRTSVEGLPLGLYLVVESAVPEMVTTTVAPFLVSLPMTTVDGNSWNYDVTVYPKNLTGDPTLGKHVGEVTSAKGDTVQYGTYATASMGDTVAYKIESKLPRITSAATYLTTYTFVDTLAQGLSYAKNDVTLSWYNEKGDLLEQWSEADITKYFTVSYENNTMTIAMTTKGLEKINPNFSEALLVIDYNCIIHSDETVVMGDSGNKNKVELTWKRTNMTYYDTLEDDCIVYTYGLFVEKQFSKGDGVFSKVKFALKNETDGYFVVANQTESGVYYVANLTNDESQATKFIPNDQGSIKIYGLEDDLYLLTELETSDGFMLLKESIRILLLSEEQVDGKRLTVTINEKSAVPTSEGENQNAFAALKVVNEKNYGIPETGDKHAFLLPVIGIAGSVLLICFSMSRKKYSH